MKFYIIQELRRGRWSQCDLTHYDDLSQAEWAMEVYRNRCPDGNSMRVVRLRVEEVFPADKEQ